MISKLTVAVLAGITLMSAPSLAVSKDLGGTHKRASYEMSGSAQIDMRKHHVHKAKTAGLYTNHEDVNPMDKNIDREIRRVNEKNKSLLR